MPKEEPKGKRKEERRKKIDIARNMKTDGVDPKVIVKYTGLSPEEIAQLD